MPMFRLTAGRLDGGLLPATCGRQAKIGRMPMFRVNTESGGVVAIVPPGGLKNGHKTNEKSLNRSGVLVFSSSSSDASGVGR
jgi:hypothetical protein